MSILYGADWFFRWLNNRRIIFVTGLATSKHVIYRGKEQRVDGLAKELSYRWDEGVEKDRATLTVELFDYGHIRLVMTREAKEAKEGLKCKDLSEGTKEGTKYKYT